MIQYTLVNLSCHDFQNYLFLLGHNFIAKFYIYNSWHFLKANAHLIRVKESMRENQSVFLNQQHLGKVFIPFH